MAAPPCRETGGRRRVPTAEDRSLVGSEQERRLHSLVLDNVVVHSVADLATEYVRTGGVHRSGRISEAHDLRVHAKIVSHDNELLLVAILRHVHAGNVLT